MRWPWNDWYSIWFKKYFSVLFFGSKRCKFIAKHIFSCAPFDLDGLATDDIVYPIQWKISRVFIVIGFILMTATIILTLITCCRQSIFGKSLHNLTGAAQTIAGICVLIALFMHPFGWGHLRVKRLCGDEASAFWPGECSLGNFNWH